MKISDNFRDLIVKEINYVAKKMEEETDLEQQLYYFSAVHGVLQRVFNLEYDPDLVYAHFILQQAYAGFNQRLAALKRAGDTTVKIHTDQLKRLITLTKDLGKTIKEKKDISEVLKKLVVLSFTTTGNGYYLYQKGVLKF